MIKVIDTDTKQDLQTRLQKQVIFVALNYIYTGVLVGINDEFYRIKDPHIIYETGEWSNKKWKDCQSMCMDEYDIVRTSVEGWGVTDKTP